jgi:hypothetical protein
LSESNPLFISDGLTSPYIVILGITDIYIDIPTTISGEVITEATAETIKVFCALAQSHLSTSIT